MSSTEPLKRVGLRQRNAIMVECTMIAKDFIEASHAINNSQYPAFARQLDQVEAKFDKLKARIVKPDTDI